MYGSKKHNDLVNIPDAVPPGIPGKKVAPHAYAGIRQDTVGPALYNPNQDAHKYTAPINNFTSSKVERKLWDPEN